MGASVPQQTGKCPPGFWQLPVPTMPGHSTVAKKMCMFHYPGPWIPLPDTFLFPFPHCLHLLSVLAILSWDWKEGIGTRGKETWRSGWWDEWISFAVLTGQLSVEYSLGASPSPEESCSMQPETRPGWGLTRTPLNSTLSASSWLGAYVASLCICKMERMILDPV